MKIITTAAEMMAESRQASRDGKTLALVPTMGALHDGHLSLITEAGRRATHITVSIFVNPTQFGPNEDFDQYPRTLEADIEAIKSLPVKVDAIFAPAVNEFSPSDANTWVTTTDMDQFLCGGTRTGHFKGVTTVVTKLFHTCRPDFGIFGLKDAQQFLILSKMVKDLNFGIEMIGVPTVRELDGLALSSRNRFLSTEEREQAVVISESLNKLKEMIDAGETHIDLLKTALRKGITSASLATIQYAEIVDQETVHPAEGSNLSAGQHILIAVAVYFGKTRLIDNLFITIPTHRLHLPVEVVDNRQSA